MILEETAGEEILSAATKYRVRVKRSATVEPVTDTVLRLAGCTVEGAAMDMQTEGLDITVLCGI